MFWMVTERDFFLIINISFPTAKVVNLSLFLLKIILILQ
jgi:hypothetical protein